MVNGAITVKEEKEVILIIINLITLPMNNKKNRGFTLIEILIVIGIIAILAAVVLVAINPARQFAQANNSQRTSNTSAILNAIGQYIADNRGALPTAMSATPIAATLIASGASNIDICANLVPTYLPALPTDPKSTHKGVSLQKTDCEAGDVYDTGYKIAKDSDGRITVSAPLTEIGVTEISITR